MINKKTSNTLYVISFSFLAIVCSFFSSNNYILSSLFVFQFLFLFWFFFKVIQYNIFSLYVIIFFFFSVYVLVPATTFIISGSPLYLNPNDNTFSDTSFTFFGQYLKNSIIGIGIYALVPLIFSARKNEVSDGFEMSAESSLLLIISGYLLLITQFLYTGAYQYIGVNHGLIREVLNRSLPLYSYLISVGIYFYYKAVGKNNIPIWLKSFGILLTVLYVFFWVKVGLRGYGLAAILIGMFGYYRNKTFKLNIKYILYASLVFVLFMVYTLRVRMASFITNPSIVEIIDFAKKSPQFLNPGTVEYSASYYNYAIMKTNKFEQDYPIQSYIEGAFMPIIKIYHKINGTEFTPLFYKFRNKHFSDRVEKLGKSGGTGYSLQYEFEMVFGNFYFIMYLFIGVLYYMIDFMYKKKGGFYEIYVVLLIPYFVTYARSGFGPALYFTKIAYALVIIGILTVVLKRSLKIRI